MPRIAGAIALGLALAVAASHALFLGWWTLLPWGIAGVVLGLWTRKGETALAGALYGFVLSFTFMVVGYTGNASLISRLPFFGLLGLFGGLCGLVLSLAG